MAKQKWTFEPGHTAAEFSARHMMVSNVRGHFKNVEGTVEIDPDNPTDIAVEVTIRAKEIWSGEPDRDEHLRSADFLDADNYPEITFKGDRVKLISENEFLLTGDLTIRGVTHEVTLDTHYLGQWDTPFWEDGMDKGPLKRAGFIAKTRINRHDFGVSWNDVLDKGGVVVSDQVDITIDVEALLDQD
ncbi:YceI family protein [Chloroflexi bacterium TSY]|nr:YceI family protein [Chloroflexi bacterium TSY]